MTNKLTIVTGRKTKEPKNFDEYTFEQRAKWLDENPGQVFHRSGFWKADSLSRLCKKLGW